MSSEKTQRATITACIISYNEERNIGDCLDSVSWCDEIVVIDSFSEDQTVEIARQHGARVEQQKWAGHVAQKNIAVETASSDWILALDCDERVTPKLREAILALMSTPQTVDGFEISRKLCYLGHWLEYGGWFPEWRVRLFRSGKGAWEGVDPHDRVHVETAKMDQIPYVSRGTDGAVILHHSFRDLSHQLKVLDRYTEIQVGELFRSGRRRRWGDLLLRPMSRFLITYFFRLGFLDGLAGFHMAVNHSYAAYMKYAKLWELQSGLTALRTKADLLPPKGESQEAGSP